MKKIILCIVIILALLLPYGCKDVEPSDILLLKDNSILTDNADIQSEADLADASESEDLPQPLTITSTEPDRENMGEIAVPDMYDMAARLLRCCPKTDNCIYSPLSLFIALSFAANGAEGNTLLEIESALGMSRAELNEYCEALCSTLSAKEKSEFSSANSIWINNLYNSLLQDSFTDAANSYYSADMFYKNFSNADIYDELDAWISGKTKNLIPKFNGQIDSEDILILINALYFNCQWLYGKYEYKSYDFIDYLGSATVADYICGSNNTYYYSKTAKAVKIPLEDGYYLLAVLPDENDIDAYLADFDGEELANLTSRKVNNCLAYWRLPVFENRSSINLDEVVKAMGIKDAFNRDLANFNSLLDRPAYIRSISQDACIIVDNNGIAAAAVTKLIYSTSSAPSNIQYLYFNRPFVYAVMDSATDTPLFIGAVREL